MRIVKLPQGKAADTGWKFDARYRKEGNFVRSKESAKLYGTADSNYRIPKEYKNTIDKSNYPNTKVIGSGIAQSRDGTWVVADCGSLVCGYHTKEEAQARYRLVKHANRLLTAH